MHASHIENKDSNLTLNSFFEISKSTILLKKKIRKIQIHFTTRKIQICIYWKYRPVLWLEKYKSVFKENTNQFWDQKKIQIYI